MVPIKNHNLFLKGLSYILKHSDKKIKAFIIGDGECRGLIEQEVEKLKIPSDNIVFTSWIRDVSQVYPGLDVIALTSFNEGTPVSLIEAQAANIPIISTNVGGIQNIVLENETALLSTIGNDKQFCEKLLDIVENDSLRNKMKSKGWQHVNKNYSYHRLVNDMKDLYRQLL